MLEQVSPEEKTCEPEAVRPTVWWGMNGANRIWHDTAKMYSGTGIDSYRYTTEMTQLSYNLKYLKYRLYPSKQQKAELEKHLELHRQVYNHSLGGPGGCHSVVK